MTLSVLHVTSTLDPLAGGTTAAVAGLATAQAQAGLNVRLLATHPGPRTETLESTLTAQGIDVHMVGPSQGPLRRHPDLAQLTHQLIEQSQVVHIHALWEEPQHLAFNTARQLNTPTVLSPHGMLDRWSLRQKWLKKQIYLQWRLRRNLKRVDALHFTTEEEKQSVSRLGLPGKPVVMPLGLDLHEFDPLPAAGGFRQAHPTVGDAPYVLFLSRLHHKKGIELLLPAFAELRKTHPDHKLVIAGPPDTPEYGQSLQDLAHQLDLSDHVLFPGMLHGAQRIQAMVDAQIFVLPSYQENFGIVVAEAAAAGLPQVVSEHVNLASFIETHDLGQVMPLNTQHITSALRTLIDDPNRLATGQKARQVTFDTFDWEKIGPRWKGIYDALSRASSPATGNG